MDNIFRSSIVHLIHISVNLPLNGVSGQLAHYSEAKVVKHAHILEGYIEALNTPPCVSCELLSTSMADALLFVNICVSGIFHGHFAQRLAVNKPCLQIVRRLLWKQTTTHSLRNNNPMFHGNL